MPEQDSGRALTLQQLVTQLLLATVYVREGEMLRREGGGEDSAELADARRRKLAFIAMLTEEERRDVRASFRTLLGDLPDTAAVPYSTADAPELYPVVAPVHLVVLGGSRPVVHAGRSELAA